MPETTTSAARFDGAALHDALDAERRSRGMTWSDVASEIGVSATTIARTKDRGPMETDGVVAMARWLGRPLEAFSETNRHLLGVESNAPPSGRLDTKALYDATNAQRQTYGMTWRSLADELGVAPAQLTHLSKRGRISAQTLMLVLLWLGEPSHRYIREFDRRLVDESAQIGEQSNDDDERQRDACRNEAPDGDGRPRGGDGRRH